MHFNEANELLYRAQGCFPENKFFSWFDIRMNHNCNYYAKAFDLKYRLEDALEQRGAPIFPITMIKLPESFQPRLCVSKAQPELRVQVPAVLIDYQQTQDGIAPTDA